MPRREPDSSKISQISSPSLALQASMALEVSFLNGAGIAGGTAKMNPVPLPGLD